MRPGSIARLALPLVIVTAGSALAGPPRAGAGGAGTAVIKRALLELPGDAGRREFALVADEGGRSVRLEIRRPGAPQPLHEFPVDFRGERALAAPVPEELRPLGDPSSSRLVLEDLDGDGILDVKVLSWWDGLGNRGWAAWRWDPTTQDHVEIPGLADLPNARLVHGEPCIGAGERGQDGSEFGQKWCWTDGRLVLTEERRRSVTATGDLVETHRVLVDGEMREIVDGIRRDEVPRGTGVAGASAPRRP